MNKNYVNYLNMLSIFFLTLFWTGCEPISINELLQKSEKASPPTDISAPLNISAAGNGNAAYAMALALNKNAGSKNVQIPVDTIFTIANGDLAGGTFKTTALAYGVILAGLLNSNQIVNGRIQLTDNASGIYIYKGTEYAGGALNDVLFTGVIANGTTSGSQFIITDLTTGSVFDSLNISTPDLSNANVAFLIQNDGQAFDGELFTGTEMVTGTYSDGILNTGGTGYTNATIVIHKECLNGQSYSGGVADASILKDPFYPDDEIINVSTGTVIGTTTGAINGVTFNGTGITTGIYTGDVQDTLCF